MISYRSITPGDVPELTELWLVCFEDTRKAVELFFKRNILSMHGYLAEKDGRIVAALYLLDCTLCGKRAHYLCGAATLPGFRRQGIMSGLIDFALADAKRRGDSYSVLLPASDSLYRFYEGLGYRVNGAACSVELTCEKSGEPVRGKADLQRLQAECLNDNFLFWNNNYVSFARDYYACYGVRCAESENAFALFEQDGGSADVFYAVYNNIKELKSLLAENGATRFSLTGSAEQPLFSGAKKMRCGMTRSLDGSGIPENIFIGITLN